MIERNTLIQKFGLASLVILMASTLSFAAQEKKKEPDVNEIKKNVPELTVAPGSGAAVDPKSYKVGPEDILLIKVWRENDLSGMVVVRPDGKISMPLIGELNAGGKTPVELTKEITDALSKLMNRPEVFIMVQEVRSRKYYITGEIRRTGSFPLVTPITVLEALSIAGGLTELANGKKIVIVRGKQRLKFNYKEVIGGKNLGQNIPLENGDHIYVP
ncbi:MAG: polysaccharide biosynthesis/export family protein [Acidobacteria bacterium]|nr:polysaccharide biosynthesis/export family protein [Acidobacteriota bacterium]